MVERVLLTGGTGKTGRLIGDRLAARGIATRHPDAPDHIRFDWHDAATHEAALDGVDAVYLVAPTDRVQQLAAMRPFLELALERKTASLVFLSASSLKEGGPMMGEVHAWLHAHAARWTARWAVLRPSWFMQNFVTQHLPSILAEGCIYSATQDGRVPFIDAADIAAVAVEALADPSFASGERVLTGPEALSYDQAAALIATAAGRPVRHCRLSAAELAGRYTGFGISQDYAALLAGMDEAIAQGAEDRTTREVERITGRAPATLETFLALHGDELRSGSGSRS